MWLLLNSAYGSKLCNLLHLSAAAARRELLLFFGAMMMVVLLLVHVLHRRPNVVLNRERERTEKSFKFPPRRGFDSGVFMRPTACVTVDDVFTTPGTRNRRITRGLALCWCAAVTYSPNRCPERMRYGERMRTRVTLCWWSRNLSPGESRWSWMFA